MEKVKPLGYVICRQGSDPLKPGYVRGHRCAICKKELQLSPSAIAAVKAAEGAESVLFTLCNPCGFEMTTRLDKDGKQLDTIYTPDFLKSFKSYVEGKGVE
jgi:hypothetical protein